MPLDRNELELVNSYINNNVTYTPDQEKYGQADWWEDVLDENGQGDCEDYAIAKLRKLLVLGWPRSQIKIGLCYIETGEYHCVLVVTVDGVDLVLDNRYPHIMEWVLLPYQWDRFYLLDERVWRIAA